MSTVFSPRFPNDIRRVCRHATGRCRNAHSPHSVADQLVLGIAADNNAGTELTLIFS